MLIEAGGLEKGDERLNEVVQEQMRTRSSRDRGMRLGKP